MVHEAVLSVQQSIGADLRKKATCDMEVAGMLVSLLVVCYPTTAGQIISTGRILSSGMEVAEVLSAADDAVNAVLETTTDTACTLILLTDSALSSSAVVQEVRSSWRGATVVMEVGNPLSDNMTLHFLELLPLARRVRLRSWCSCVAIVSLDHTFLESFSEWSLRSRLLVWDVPLLVVTRLAPPFLLALLSTSWTFASMNAAFINLENDSPMSAPSPRYGVYVHLPYGPAGPEVVHVASWTSTIGLQLHSHMSVLPDKYSNLNGVQVNVAARPYLPYWGEAHEFHTSDSPVKRYFGPDYQMLKAVSNVLNFTFRVLTTESWTEVEDKVTARECFLVPIVYVMLIVRLQRFDFTYNYLFDGTAFVMAKPTMEIKWQGLYRPLSGISWACVVASLFGITIVLWLMPRKQWGHHTSDDRSFWTVLHNVTGLLVGQGLSRRLAGSFSSRVVISTWLICSYIIVSVYIGNLTASLTLPKTPPRAETVTQLEAAADRVTVKSYMKEMRETLSTSSNLVQNAIAQKMAVVLSMEEALKEVVEKRQAYVENGRVLRYLIAKHFTERDGSTRLYVGREQVLPGFLGWLLPHDAPYKAEVDRWMMAVVESGMYIKWTEDVLRKTRFESQQEQRRRQADRKESHHNKEVDGSISLTMKHLQGAFFLLFFGTSLAFLAFVLEIVAGRSSVRLRDTCILSLPHK